MTRNPQTDPLTFGEKAVGLSFNPSGDDNVSAIKRAYANIVDILNGLRQSQGDTDGEIKRMYSVAITEAQTSQMWAVKAATWKK
jgi:hypothetical protein